MAELKPYLRFFDNLSQLYINQYTLGIVLIATKLYLFTSSVENRLEGIEKTYTGTKTCLYLDYLLYESPKQISLAANYLIKKGLADSLKVFFTIMSETLVICSSIIYFILDIWLGTYACLFTVAAEVTVDVATNATEAVISVSNKTMHAVAKDLDIGLNGLSEGVDDLIKIYDKVEDKIKQIFTSSTSKDQTNISNKVKHLNLTISSLNNFYINPSINSKLKKLSGEVPDFSTLKNKTKHWIETPFEKIASELKNQNYYELTEPLNSSLSLKPYKLILPNNNTTASLQINYNSTSMKWCEKELVPEIKKFMKKSKKDLITFKKVIIIIAIILFIASLVPEFYKEFFFWRKMSSMRSNLEDKLAFEKNSKEYKVSNQLFTDDSSQFDFKNTKQDYKEFGEIKAMHTGDDFNLGSKVQDAYLMTFQDWQINLLGRIPFLKDLITFNSNNLADKNNNFDMKKLKRNWTLKYMLSKRTSLLLLICIAGYFICLIQYLVIHRIDVFINTKNHKKLKIFKCLLKYNKIKQVVDAIESSLDTWQDTTNNYIKGVETRGNNEVVVKNIDYLADKVNKTALMIYTDISNTIDTAFNQTVFDKPLKNLMNCVIGNKLLSISKGAVWVKKEVHVDLPKISLSEAYSIFNANNSTGYQSQIMTEITSIEADMINEINHVIQYYYKDVIKSELILISALFAVYLFQYVSAKTILKLHYGC